MSTHKHSPFAEAALDLDKEFNRIERLAAEIDSISLQTTTGMERARKVLVEFEGASQNVISGIQYLAKSLHEAKARMEATTGRVAARAEALQVRHQETEQMLERFRVLGENARIITAAIGELHAHTGRQLNAEELEVLKQGFPQTYSQLGVLVEEARQLMQDAHSANMKVFEKNADSLRQSLQAARSKLAQFVDQSGGSHLM